MSANLWEHFRRLDLDIARYEVIERKVRSPGMLLRLFLITPGFQFVFARRFQDMIYCVPFLGRLLGRVAWWWTCILFSSELAIAADLGGGLYIPHPYGIVLGRCDVGQGATILQNVTIGRLRENDQGYARLGTDVYIGAGAVILGAVNIGDGAVIGANSLVRADVPANTLAVGSPARIVIV